MALKGFSHVSLRSRQSPRVLIQHSDLSSLEQVMRRYQVEIEGFVYRMVSTVDNTAAITPDGAGAA